MRRYKPYREGEERRVSGMAPSGISNGGTLHKGFPTWPTPHQRTEAKTCCTATAFIICSMGLEIASGAVTVPDRAGKAV